VDAKEVLPGVHVTREYALWLPRERALAISDLHLGYEGALQEAGVAIPRRQKGVMLERLGRLLDRYEPETVIVDGDFKHEFSRNLEDEWKDVQDVLDFLYERTVPVLVRGNHDNYLMQILAKKGLDLIRKFECGGFTFVHGHDDPGVSGPLVLGHEHPAVKLRDGLGATISVSAFVVQKDLILLPAFSPLALGVDVTERPKMSPLLAFRDLSESRIYGIDESSGLMEFGRLVDLERVSRERSRGV
jgi:putative SbcD/Mre11-related phosphoesterase